MTRVISSAAHAIDAKIAKVSFQVQHRSGPQSHLRRDSRVSPVLAADWARQARPKNWFGAKLLRACRMVTVAIRLPLREAALMDILGLSQTGDLTATVTMRQES